MTQGAPLLEIEGLTFRYRRASEPAVRDVSLFVTVIGQGYPLVLLHGGPGVDHITLLPLRPLAERFTLVFYDHRCNGRSSGAEVGSMTWDNLTADAEALRLSLGFEQWAVLGHSFGGMVALEYALRYPRSLSKLVLLDTCGDSRWQRSSTSSQSRPTSSGCSGKRRASSTLNTRARRARACSRRIMRKWNPGSAQR